ncbi:MAG: GDP-mannose-dependent alpha-(1-6)-phosphatidylinositol monomannoside mannosyltransferase [Promethearchaeota archaeon]|jgi:glycosyltransferase involved in cell wall biosynthesis|nr:MAG: GDP-mannose-dependent alpha-(1-6)-phosphatidylinositol monomannoside mannosyltransferase [Candidatus Lokiarchaeota archaeon]
MRKLNICLISFKIPPDSMDGTAKFFRGIYEYLKKQGHNITLLTGKWNYKLQDPDIKQIDIIPRRFFWIFPFYIGVIKYLRSHKFDIIHGNNPKGALPIILANKKQFGSTIHDLGFFTRIPFEKILIRFIAKTSRFITTCSTQIKKDLVKEFPDLSPNKIFNLYSAIEEKFMPFPKKARKLKEKMGLEGPTILYIGRVSYYKGVDDIIRAYYLAKKKIPELNLIIGGLPDFRTQNQYESWKQKYKDISFVGYIPDDQIPIYYSLGEIFITYSYAFEGFGLTPIEAIACGTPVICSSIPVFKEVLQDNAIFVKPRSPKSLADAIVDLITNDKKRENLIEKARRFIQRYTWQEVGEKLEKVYQLFLKMKESD